MSRSASPLILRSSGWGGNDGNWSTYHLDVGTPAQKFEVLCSTTSNEIWVPVPEGCESSIPNCASSRGTRNGGFQVNESSSWEQIGIYDLSQDDNLFPNSGDAALYGLDKISLGTSGNSTTFSRQIIGGISSYNFWLGVFGLGVQPGNFSNLPNTATTLLSAAKNSITSPSLSYGFSAGAAYRNAPGSIVMGGYDRAAFEPSNLTFPLAFAGARSLTVRLKNLVVSNTLQGTLSPAIETSGLNVSIDSTVAQIWLPDTMCDILADALGLQYDNNTGLYFVNATTRQNLLSHAPEFTFAIAAASAVNNVVGITLPYAAFDQQIGQPWSTKDTTYFPLRRAANESQFVLGRTFLQEAYLVVDWERQSFTLGQSLHRPGVSSEIVTILPASRNGGGIATGAIAGIVVAAVLLAILVSGGLLFLRRRKRRQQRAEEAKRAELDRAAGKAELPAGSSNSKAELMSNHVHEMASKPAEKKLELEGCIGAQLLGAGEIYELPGHQVGHEMETPISAARDEK